VIRKAEIQRCAQRAGGPVETLLLPGCGHQPHLEKREAVLAAADFLTRHPGGASQA